MRNNQRKKLLIAFAFFVIVLAAGLFAIPMPQMDRFPRAFLDMVHLPCFALLGFFVSQIWIESKSKSWLRRIIAFALLLGVGYATELLQRSVGRTASLQDLLADVFGAAVGLCWSWRSGVFSRAGKRILEFCCVISICGGIWFPVAILIDVFHQRQDFPVLSSFETPLEKYRWYFQNSTSKRSREFVTHGSWSLKLTLHPIRYPSATLYFPYRDWTAWSHLAFDIYNPDETAELILKIHDDQHTGNVNDRFHDLLTVRNGWTHFKIPLSKIVDAPEGRKMDLSRIDKVQYFMRQPRKPVVFYLDHLRLEN